MAEFPPANSAAGSRADDFPRVLIVSHNPLSATANNGKTMAMLFTGWPTDRLAQLFVYPATPDSPVCVRYWRVTESDLLTARLSGGKRQAGGPVTIAHTAERPDGTTTQARLFSRLRVLNAPVLDLLREGIWAGGQWDTPALQRWIDDFKPELLYFFVGGSVFAYNIVLSLIEQYRLPLVLHFTDDYWSDPQQAGFLTRRYHRQRTARFANLLQASTARLVIGDAMGQDFARRYGHTYQTFMSCLEDTAWSDPSITRPPRERIRFVYTGGLHLDRWQSIQEIGMALAELEAEGLYGELLIYTNPLNSASYHDALTLPPVMRMAGWATADQMPQILQDADVLVHVESFHPKQRAYTHLSVSTKIPEYLMAGRCLLAYGPAEIASIRYFTESNSGIVVGDKDRAALTDALRRILTDERLRRDIGQSAHTLAVSRHSAAIERRRFRLALLTATRQDEQCLVSV